jgi:LEA14-like dessication related protein
MPIIGLTLLALLAGVTSMDWRSWVSEPVLTPTFQLNRTEFRALDDTRVAADLYLQVANPNTFGVQVLSYTLSFKVADIPIPQELVERVVDFPAGETGELLLPVTLRWDQFDARLQTFSLNLPATLPFKAAGTMTVAIPGSNLPVPFSYHGELPLVVEPRVEPCDFGITKVGLTDVRLEIDICVSNPSARPVKLASTRYEVRVNDRTLVEAELGQDLSLAPGATERVPIIGTMTVEQAGRRLVAAVLGMKTDADVRVLGAGEFDTGIGVVPMHFNVKRTMTPQAN